MVHSADLVVYFERAGFGYTSIISSSLLLYLMAIHAVYCTRGDYGIYIMQHYYHRLATYCMYVDTYSYQLLLFFLLSSFTSFRHWKAYTRG